MTSSFQSFDRSPLGAFIKTPLGVRNAAGELVFTGDFSFTDSDKNMFDVGFLSVLDIDKIGENEGFVLSEFTETFAPLDIHTHKNKLYVTGDMVSNIDETRTYNGIAVLNESDGIWEILAGTDLAFEVVDPEEDPFQTGGNSLCSFGGALIVVGRFTNANGVAKTRGVAGWDGEAYFALGDILDEVTGVTLRACTIHQGNLWVGGLFSQEPENNINLIAEWNGSVWETTHFASNDPNATQAPHALQSFNNKLSVAGVGEIHEWTGATWNTISTTVKQGGGDGTIFALTVFESDLIVGGDFSDINSVSLANVGRWDGTTFKTLGSGLLGVVNGLIVFKSDLYAIGLFSTNGESDTVIGLAVWNKKTEVWDAAHRDPTESGLTGGAGIALAIFPGKLNGMLPEE